MPRYKKKYCALCNEQIVHKAKNAKLCTACGSVPALRARYKEKRKAYVKNWSEQNPVKVLKSSKLASVRRKELIDLLRKRYHVWFLKDILAKLHAEENSKK